VTHHKMSLTDKNPLQGLPGNQLPAVEQPLEQA
jgi:hypothetical protein